MKATKKEVTEMAQRYGGILKGIAGVDIFERSRERIVSWCRFMAMWQLLKDGYTSLLIGDVFGLDHSSVLNARTSIDAMCLNPDRYSELVPIFKEFRKRVLKDGQRDEESDKSGD